MPAAAATTRITTMAMPVTLVIAVREEFGKINILEREKSSQIIKTFARIRSDIVGLEDRCCTCGPCSRIISPYRRPNEVDEVGRASIAGDR